MGFAQNCFLTQTTNVTFHESVLAAGSTGVCMRVQDAVSKNSDECAAGNGAFTCFREQEIGHKFQILYDLGDRRVESLRECMQYCCEEENCVGFDYVNAAILPWFIWLGGLFGVLFFITFCLTFCNRTWKRHPILFIIIPTGPMLTAFLYWAWLHPMALKQDLREEIESAGGIGDLVGIVLGMMLCRLLTRQFPLPRRYPAPEPGLVPYDRLEVTASGGGSGPGEVAKNLLDENRATDVGPFFTNKWNVGAQSAWIEIAVADDGPPIVLQRYALRSANDFPTRDPREWQLFGIDTMGQERLIHKQEAGDHWAGERWAWRTFTCDGGGAEDAEKNAMDNSCPDCRMFKLGSAGGGDWSYSSFRKFKLEISANHGDKCTQLGQLKLYQKEMVYASV